MASDIPSTPAPLTPETPATATGSAGAAPGPGGTAAALPAASTGRWLWWLAAAVVAGLSLASVALALYSQQRIKSLEQELVRRQQESQNQAVEARVLAKQATELVQANDTKMGLLEGRVAETVLQRSQLEDLIQQLSRSRDESVLADLDSALRVAMQQAAITGSAEPLASALRTADDRLARINQPRLERVHRALLRDIDRVKTVAVADIASLTIKLDEVVRMVDEMPLLSKPDRRVAAPPEKVPASAPARALPAGARGASAAAAARAAAVAASAAAPEPALWTWWPALREGWLKFTASVWGEVKSLVRVTHIDQPEAMLLEPEQAWFLRENLKLRLLNARLALQSRQFDTVQSDLQEAQTAINRYFDRSARRAVVATELIRQVSALARQVSVPRPDETLAAIAAVQSGR